MKSWIVCFAVVSIFCSLGKAHAETSGVANSLLSGKPSIGKSSSEAARLVPPCEIAQKDVRELSGNIRQEALNIEACFGSKETADDCLAHLNALENNYRALKEAASRSKIFCQK